MLGLVAITGLFTGIIEFLVAYIAYKFYNRTGNAFEWLKIFAIAVAILGTSHILCKFIGHGLLNLPRSYAIGVPFKFVGLTLMIYALLKGVEYRKTKEATIITAIVGLYFLLSSYYTLTILKASKTIFFMTSHWLFLLVIPWYVAYLLWKVYKTSDDETALIFSIGMITYGLASLINTLLLMNGASLQVSMSIAMIPRLIAEIIIMAGFLLAERASLE